MKKLILSLFAAGFAATSFAHGGLPEGGLTVYGLGSYSSQHGTSTSKFGTANSNTSDNPRYLNWEVSPGVGFNITECLTVGVDFNYTGSKTTYDKKNLGGFPSVDQYKTYDYGVGPFVRMTCPLSEHFFCFGQVTAHYLNGRLTTRTVTALTGGNSYVKDDNYKGLDASFVPAVGAMLTKSLGLTFSIGGLSYQYKKYDYSTQNLPAGSSLEGKDNMFNVTFGQQVNFGIQKYFGCGRHMRRGNAEPMDETRHMDTSDDEMDSDKKKHKRRKSDDD